MAKSATPEILIEEFEEWMRKADYDESAIKSRISNLRKIDSVYGNLYDHWRKDRMQSILDDLAYSAKDQRNQVPNPSEIEIDGDLYTGLATYRQTVRLFIKFLMSRNPETTVNPTFVFDKISNILSELGEKCRGKEICKANLQETVITPLLKALSDGLKSEGYSFDTECQVIADVDENDVIERRDRYDIMGESKVFPDFPVIIIEVDTHRSDQVSKKMVSRLAINIDKKLIYVSVLYPNNHVKKNAEKRECAKYVDDISTIFATLPDKWYLNINLF